ncbi:hypothetical protein CATMIT_01939, partial [Catenibacterium mitsuokai DSM 15897]
VPASAPGSAASHRSPVTSVTNPAAAGPKRPRLRPGAGGYRAWEDVIDSHKSLK